MHVLQASFSRHEYRARQDNKTGKAAAGMVGDSIQSAHRRTAYLPLGTAATGSVDDRPHMAVTDLTCLAPGLGHCFVSSRTYHAALRSKRSCLRYQNPLRLLDARSCFRTDLSALNEMA